MATTPPPPSPSSLRVPPAPRYGPAYDQYEPYPTRSSARLASQRAVRDDKTPPPSFPAVRAQTGSKGSPKRQRKLETEAMSPPRSNPSSPRKRAAGRPKVRSGHPAPSLHHASNLSDSFDIAQPSPSQRNAQPASRSIMAGELLPTPMKTPSRKTVDSSIAGRALFPPSSVTKGKKAKKPTGYSLESFSDDLAPKPAPIEIYTDSRDRIPEMDMSEDNPFYANPTTAKAPEKGPTRSSKRQAAKRDAEVDDSLTREDGIYCVFRGKKIFNKFSDEMDEEDESDLGLLAARPDLLNEDVSDILSSVRPLTRSSIKPRILFPSATDKHATEAHEEDATDDDEHVAKDELATPPPKSPMRTPASPGATMRLRSTARFDILHVDETPTVGPVAEIKRSEPRKKRGSPFDGWQRKKQSPEEATGVASKKREAGSVASPGGPALKKTRNMRSN